MKWDPVLTVILRTPLINLDKNSMYVKEHYPAILLLGTIVYFHRPFAEALLVPLTPLVAFQELEVITGYRLTEIITGLTEDFSWATNFYNLLWPKLILPSPTLSGLKTALGPIRFFPEHTAFFYHLIVRGPLQLVPMDQWQEWMASTYQIEISLEEIQHISRWNTAFPPKDWLVYLSTSLFGSSEPLVSEFQRSIERTDNSGK